MGRDVLTDVSLRARWKRGEEGVLRLKKGTIITPAAADFIRENKIEIIYCDGADDMPFGERSFANTEGTMTRVKMPVEGGKAKYIIAATGETVYEKPESMTHLRGNILVEKNHKRIIFRGGIDSLMAKIISLQCLCHEQGQTALVEDLSSVLICVRSILGSEVKDEPMGEVEILGMDAARLRYVSHNVKEVIGIDHPIPDYSMGRIPCGLNELRTFVREVELMAIEAFKGEGALESPAGDDIIKTLNRLSSCIYIIFCKCVSAGGSYGQILC